MDSHLQENHLKGNESVVSHSAGAEALGDDSVPEVASQAGNTLSPVVASVVAALLVTLVALLLWHVVGDMRNTPPADADSYRAMASGHNAIRPFANRVLAPFLAHNLGRITASSDDTGFFVLGLVSLWAMLYGVLSPVLRGPQSLGFACALCFMLFWKQSFSDYFLPDLLHAALLMVFMAFLRRRWWALSAAMLLPMYLARESTLLVSLIAVPILWRLVGRRVGLLFLGASLTGLAVSKFATRHGLPNIHGLNDTLYMVGKIPWNLSKNVFGITVWVNTDPLPTPPHLWQLPHWIHLDRIHQIGLYSPSSFTPGVTLIGMLLAFGLGPCVMACLLLRVPLRRLLPRTEPYLWVAAIYGGVAYLLAPALGTGVIRLAGYGWPLFLVYLPAMMPRIWRLWRPWQVLCLLVLHLGPYWILPRGWGHMPWHLAMILGVCDALAFALLLRAPIAAAGASPQMQPEFCR